MELRVTDRVGAQIPVLDGMVTLQENHHYTLSIPGARVVPPSGWGPDSWS